jgi:hypothetical protein
VLHRRHAPVIMEFSLGEEKQRTLCCWDLVTLIMQVIQRIAEAQVGFCSTWEESDYMAVPKAKFSSAVIL